MGTIMLGRNLGSADVVEWRRVLRSIQNAAFRWGGFDVKHRQNQAEAGRGNQRDA
jgi:hypothetical protein